VLHDEVNVFTLMANGGRLRGGGGIGYTVRLIISPWSELMLKWFRIYNKYILAVGASLLMIAFLIPQSVQMFSESTRNVTIGTIGDEEIKLDDRRAAASDMAIVSMVFGKVHQLLPRIAIPESLESIHWLLILRDARRMGLGAGDHEVANLLGMLGYDDENKVRRLTIEAGVTEDMLYRAFRDWITIEQYRELAAGQGHVSIENRLNTYVSLINQLQMGGVSPYAILSGLARASQGLPRMSTPVLMRTIADQLSNVTIAAVPVRSTRYLEDVTAPDEAALVALFDQYKNDLPGEGEPYGFGYKIPDRVKIEYMTIPFDQVVQLQTVDESRVVRYYDEHPDQFMTQPPAQGSDDTEEQEVQPQLRPYVAVRDQIVSRLKTEDAEDMIGQMARTAQSLLQRDVRQMETDNGYRVIRDGWQPTPFDEVAEALQEQFNVLPSTRVRGGEWLSRDDLAQIEGLGTSRLPGRGGADFVSYVMSARELGITDDNPLIGLHLQTRIPSRTLTNPQNGSRYIFRIVDAEAARVPTSLDEVRPRVEQDAKQLAAWEMLLGERDDWRNRVGALPLDELARQLETEPIGPVTFPRLQRSFTGELDLPDTDPIAPDASFIDAVFDLARAAVNEGEIADVPQAKRSDAIANPHDRTLYLVRVDDFSRMARSDYDMFASSPELNLSVQEMLLGRDGAPDPLAFDTLAARVGYKSENDRSDDDKHAE
jgi:hypothetical protein